MAKLVDMENRFTVSEAARIMGLSSEYVRLMARQGKIDTVKLGTQHFVKIPANRVTSDTAA